MKLINTLSGAALMLASATAMAQGPSYSFVQGGYQVLTGSGDPDGLFVEASYQVANQAYIAGGYDFFSESGYDISRLSARGGYFHPLENNMHLYGEAGLVRSRVEVDVPYFNINTLSWGTRTVSDTSTDLMVEGGIRAMVMPELELRGALRRVTGDYDETYLIAEGAFEFSPNLSGVAGLTRMDEVDEFRVQAGIRYAF